MALFFYKYHSPLGELIIIASENAIHELLLPGQFSCYSGKEVIQTENTPILYTVQWLDDYFSGKNPSLDHLWLSPAGTPFQTQVWQILLKIPYGQTVTYGQIADEICRQNQIGKMSAQAVGQAVGKNPISILIPCHRVTGSGNKLTGYAGGIDKKVMLLKHEGIYIEKVL